MKRKKLKDWVIPTLSIFVIVGSFLCYYLITDIQNNSLEDVDNYVTDALIDNTETVNKEVKQTKAIEPYNSEKVSISKKYYNPSSTKEEQETSLIKYENIYMPNTGILYSSDEQFDIIASLDGTVKNIKEDNILGTVIEIECSNNIITIYQSVKDAKVKQGDKVTQGTVIASSGPNKLSDEKENCLHFEVYKESKLINPEDFYTMDINS